MSIDFWIITLTAVVFYILFLRLGNPPDYIKKLFTTEAIPKVGIYIFLPIVLALLVWAAWKVFTS